MLRHGYNEDNIYDKCGVKYEGWLQFYTCPFNGYIPKEIPWQNGYCVFRSDDLTFVCYRDPEASRFITPSLPSFRLDSGCRVPPPPIESSTLPRRPISNGFSTLTRRTQRLMQSGSATLDRFTLKKRKNKLMDNMTMGRGESTYMLGTIRVILPQIVSSY
ncbi:unnamed protein product [Bursaphelenchus xylophilus]|uniref:(pine wood nematode) hypothetical protein n=1 Tax=Bursaphelenchus xylophilus TaxID=6326 RepID=A0A1I7S9Q7_BURXY|nr:unnamed protein product [Bursaphelenchus xylophilus]CAG9129174.1 unnamed protein product [Bursaphelenchus xylophilus]